MKKAIEELPILHNFIDFINKQVGVYCDSISSFNGNKARVERQKARICSPSNSSIKNGQPTVMWASFEDQGSPDVLHHRIIGVDDFIQTNSEAGYNEQQICWAIIVFIFAHWNEKIRPQLAKIRSIETSDIKVDEFGDLRILRNAIIHDKGILTQGEYNKIKVINNLVNSDYKITFTHDQMHKLFIHMKQGIARLALEHTGHLPGAPRAEEIVGIAIQ